MENQLKKWTIIGWVGTVLFMSLLCTHGRVSELILKVPKISYYYSEIIKPIITRPYIF